MVNPCHPKTKRDSSQCFSLSDWLGGGSEGWGEGTKEERVGGEKKKKKKAHTYCSPTWAQLQQVPATLPQKMAYWLGKNYSE